MFKHIFTYRLKSLLRNKEMLFWTLLFPFILGGFFFFAFSNLISQENFETIPVAVVENQVFQDDVMFQETLNTIQEGDNPLFSVTKTTKEQANQLLEQEKIKGYFELSESGMQESPAIDLTVKESGLDQTILKSFLDEYIQKSAAVSSILSTNPQAIQNGLLEAIGEQVELIREVPVGNAEPNPVLNYYYCLLAMVCLFGSFWGLLVINDVEPNMSATGARRSLAPTHKLKVVLFDLFAAVILHFVELLIVLAYLIYLLKVDFGSQIPYVILTCFVGSVTGVSFGACISSIVKANANVKSSILSSVSLSLCFLSGLMFADMKQLVANNVPFLAYINPASLISDAFYSLYFYTTTDRYFLNILLLCVISAIFCIITYFVIRRQKHASI